MDVASGLHIMRLVQQINLARSDLFKNTEAIIQIKKRSADHCAVLKVVLESLQKIDEKLGCQSDCQTALDFIVISYSV